MDWPGRMVGGSRWTASERAYAHACLRASCPSPPQHPSWWGLCALLSQHQLRHASIRPVSQLWSELLPFLLLADERIAERAVEEYLRYLDDPRQVDLQWLGLRINEALDQVET